MRLTPYQRILRNAEKGMGVHLSPEETFHLSLDDAIATRAALDDENDEGVSDEDAASNKGFGVGTIKWPRS